VTVGQTQQQRVVDLAFAHQNIVGHVRAPRYPLGV
jgi:hypothetical protein